jgi:peptide deformylase
VFGFEKDKMHFAANPIIVEASDEVESGYEGCLSFWEWRGQVPRPRSIVLKFQLESGAQVIAREEGERARLLLHEIDHLDGILYVDRMKEGERLLPLRQYHPTHKAESHPPAN